MSKCCWKTGTIFAQGRVATNLRLVRNTASAEHRAEGAIHGHLTSMGSRRDVCLLSQGPLRSIHPWCRTTLTPSPQMMAFARVVRGLNPHPSSSEPTIFGQLGLEKHFLTPVHTRPGSWSHRIPGPGPLTLCPNSGSAQTRGKMDLPPSSEQLED